MVFSFIKRFKILGANFQLNIFDLKICLIGIFLDFFKKKSKYFRLIFNYPFLILEKRKRNFVI